MKSIIVLFLLLNLLCLTEAFKYQVYREGVTGDFRLSNDDHQLSSPQPSIEVNEEHDVYIDFNTHSIVIEVEARGPLFDIYLNGERKWMCLYKDDQQRRGVLFTIDIDESSWEAEIEEGDDGVCVEHIIAEKND